MKMNETLSRAFDSQFEDKLANFLVKKGWLENLEELKSVRYLNRSIVPHVEKLSETFNRLSDTPSDDLERYWKNSSNVKNLRLAYLLSFMPPNAARMAGIWGELHRLGFQFKEAEDEFRAIDWGTGPGSAVLGIEVAEKITSLGLPSTLSVALIEKQKALLDIAQEWLEHWFESRNDDWSIRKFHRTIDFAEPLLPRSAPKFHLWTMSYVLNESPLFGTDSMARNLLHAWENHLEEDGLVILVEPALKEQSRKLLSLRRELILSIEAKKLGYRVLLPCLGHQACGALAQAEDWCHEEIVWWRPPLLKKLDEMTGLDRKALHFSYLVIQKTREPLYEILPKLKAGSNYDRLVSPVHRTQRGLEFYSCGSRGKSRVIAKKSSDFAELERGSILENADLKGDLNSTSISKTNKIL